MTTIMTEEQPPAFDEIDHTLPSIRVSTETGSQYAITDGYLASRDEVAQATTASALLNGSGEEDEELPQYHDAAGPPAELPHYEERHLLAPVVSYTLYQISRKLQVLTPATLATFDRPRYRVTTRSGPSMFSKKPDYTLTRLPTGTAAAAESSPGKDVGFVCFDRATQIPWMPRATVQILSDGPGSTSNTMTPYDMSAPNFSDWKFKLNNELYYWRLTDKPTALSLVEHSSTSVVARFTYSKQGTNATRGADVGVIDIFGGSRSEDTEVIELVLSTVQVPINHWKNMGRHYKNNITPRNCSIGGPPALGNSFFAGDGRAAPRRASNAV